MRNLKRVLCLSLAVVMLLGMMVVGTSANNFTDSSEIVNTEAVDTMNALNIINGTPDGSFNPKGIVTRAEMCKMICVALNGGKDPQLGNNYTSFTDTKGNWAAGYIEYCYNLGIVSGRGEGIFDPTGTVTGSEAAKMLLVAIGYNAESEGFVGAGWEMAVNVIASQKGLYDDLVGMGVSAGLSRDNAAQMVYNAINAVMVEYSYNLGTVNGDLTTIAVAKDVANASIDTLLEKKFDMKTTYGFMTGAITYTSTTEKYDYTLNTMTGDTLTSIKTKVDYSDLYGQYVKVLWKNDSSKTIYGMYAEDSTVMASGYNGDIGAINATDVTLKVNDVAYKVENTTIPVREAISGTAKGTISAITATAPYSLKLIDTNDNGKADVMIVTPFVIGKVSYVGTDTYTLGAVGGGVAKGEVDKDDAVTYSGIAKNDYVCYIAAANVANGKVSVTKLDVTSGSVTGTKTSKYLVDGEWLSNVSGTAISANDTIDYIAFGGIIYYAKVNFAATSGDVAMVIDAGAAGGFTSDIQAKLMFTDGTKTTVTLDKIDGTDVTLAATAQAFIGKLVTYTKNTSDEYSLKTIPAASTTGNLAGYDGSVTGAAFVNASNSVAGKELADDAVVYVLYCAAGGAAGLGTNTAKVYTGKEVKNNFGDVGAAANCYALYSDVSGFSYGKIAVIADIAGGLTTANAAVQVTAGANYGYLTADAYQTIIDGTTYRNFTFTDGSNIIEAKEESSAALTDMVAGAIITFDNDGANKIKNVSVPAVATNYITGYEESTGKIQINGLLNTVTHKVNSDTVVIYVNSTDKVAASGGSISIADKPDGTNYRNNVRYIGTAGVEGISLLVVDVNNNMKANPSMTTTSLTGTTVAAIQLALDNGNNVTVTDATTVASTISVPAGQTLTFEAALTASADITGAGNLVVDSVTAGDFGFLKTTAIEFTGATAAILDLEAIPVVAGKTLTIAAASTGNATATTWYTAAGANETSTGAGDGVVGTSLAGVVVPIGTYVGSTVYTTVGGATATAWLAQ